MSQSPGHLPYHCKTEVYPWFKEQTERRDSAWPWATPHEPVHLTKRWLFPAPGATCLLGRGWSGVAVRCSQSLTVSELWESGNPHSSVAYRKPCQGLCWATQIPSIPLVSWLDLSITPADVCVCLMAMTQRNIPRVPAASGAGQ